MTSQERIAQIKAKLWSCDDHVQRDVLWLIRELQQLREERDALVAELKEARELYEANHG